MPAPIAAAPIPAAPAAVSPADAAFFEAQVRPLLVEHCVRCHGPKKQESALRMDSRLSIVTGGDNGPAIVPGQAAASMLVKAIRYEGDTQMPPKKKLKDDQIAVLTRWVDIGAPWPGGETGVKVRSGTITDEDRKFWSFQPVADPPVPNVDDPAWSASPIDRFVLANMRAAGARPAAPADKRTLLRRATYDLTGLPPTPADVDAFLADASPNAFEKVVDRLLASPAYGQRWGRHWLDVVRYADTAGETGDFPVHDAYRYRNYVIDSFNADKPYDAFVREQLAGDVIATRAAAEPDAAAKLPERIAATGYLAISRRFGYDSENYEHLTIQDTIDNVGQTFLGLTIGCARCHDHKFDPVSVRDYYGLYGIFQSTRYPFAGSEQKKIVRSVAALVPPAEARQRAADYEAKLASIEQRLAALKAGPPGGGEVRVRLLDDIDGDFELQAYAFGGSRGVPVPPWVYVGNPTITRTAQSPIRNFYVRGGLHGVSFPGGADDYAIRQAIRSAVGPDGKSYFNADFLYGAKPAGADGSFRVYLGHGAGDSPAVELFASAEAFFVRNGEAVEQVQPLKAGTWYNVQLVLDTKAKTYAGAIAIHGAAAGSEVKFEGKAFKPGWDGTLDQIMVDGRGHLPGAKPPHDLDNVSLRDIPPVVAAPTTQPIDGLPPTATVAELTHAYRALVQAGPCDTAYAAAEGTPQDARIQKRGEPTTPGDEVPRGFVEILGGGKLPAGTQGSGRLELAKWIADPANPLTSRVMVNRIWEHHFGAGLVRTENDFGMRGQAPTHPELLDHLAKRFVADGWSVKRMHRLIMLSQTYQLASRRPADAAAPAVAPVAADPENKLLTHFGRRRLDAESIRDSMLAVSGNLDPTPGLGHPFPALLDSGFSQHGPFAAVYETPRRSVYLMTQRFRRHPFLALFDGADPNATTPRRSETTVPTQALFLMNSQFVHDQSDALAKRVLAAGTEPALRVAFAYRAALARDAEPAEVERGMAFLAKYQEQLKAANVPPDRHDPLAWAAFGRTLLVSNEFLYLD